MLRPRLVVQSLRLRARRRHQLRQQREQLRKAWTLEYESSHNQDNGGRLKRLGLVAGNVLPLWPALAQTVAERQVEMNKEDQRLRAVRVVLPSETIVGVRFPPPVLNTLRAALAQRSRQRAAHARQHVRAEPPTPVDAAKLRAATTPPKTIQSFFKNCLLYTSPSPRDRTRSRMPSSA